LSKNPNAIHILEKNLDKVKWDNLSSNPNAIHIIEKNLDKVDWGALSGNPNAIHIIEKNLDKVDWEGWHYLSRNPNAIPLLEKNLDKTNWEELSKNPNIFTIDYNAMKTNMYKEGGIAEELMQNRFHPRNINKFTNWGFPGFDNNDVDAEKERQAKLLHH
jgi:hypothetical protein